MDNQDKKNVKKGIPVYLVFLFLIAVLGYVIYAQNKSSDQSNSQSQQHQTQKTASDANENAKNDEKSDTPTLAQIIKGRRTWDAIAPHLYGDKAPDFTVKTIDGNDLSLSEFRKGNDKEIVLVFWATWCGYCVKEIPHLNKLTEEMGDKAKILAISDESADTIKKFAQDRKMNYKLATASRGYRSMGNLYTDATRMGRPTAMHVDKNGNIKIIYVGAPSYEELKNIVKAEK